MRPRLVSGVKPTSIPHIGNYIGALRQWVTLQHEYDAFLFIADLHAITVPQDPVEMRLRTMQALACYLGVGIDPEKVTLYIHSQIPAHAELGWIMSTIARIGEMERMTQFKDKSRKEGSETAGLGLLAYPALMAADILLYDADVVPVGEDQLQHLELTRVLGRRFNDRFGETFRIPKPLIQTHGARIMSLADPLKKMSKSDESAHGTIFLTDDAETIAKKVKRAVTDTEGSIRYAPEEKPAVSNLLEIFHHMSGDSIASLEERFAGQSYGAFKDALTEAIIDHLTPIRRRIEDLLRDHSAIAELIEPSTARARKIAEEKITLAKQRVGLGI